MNDKEFSDIILENLETVIDKLENESDLIDDDFFLECCSEINYYSNTSLSEAIFEVADNKVPIYYDDIYKEAPYYEEEIMEVIRSGVTDKTGLHQVLQQGIGTGYANGLYENIENLSLSCSYLNTIDYVKENKDEFNEICSSLEKVDKEFKVEKIIDDLKEIADKNSDLYKNEDLKVDEKSEELIHYLRSLENNLELKKELEENSEIRIPKKTKQKEGNER